MIYKNINTKIEMDKEQEMGYILLACKEIGLSSNQVKQIHSSLLAQFNTHTPEEAKREGINWFQSLEKE
ncbi:hypothetical protein [Niallia sp. 01092]|uniref:hypothetical protein n=1 Tax=unclassified Niallia TaxID=2837522 RepID=UPI003FD53C35